METYFRLNREQDDPQSLLDRENQRSEPWGGTIWGRCDKCGGSGEIDDSERDGISVFPDEDGLYRHMRKRDADIQGSVLVELEGKPSGDEDFDADEGALLIHPTRIVDVRAPRK